MKTISDFSSIKRILVTKLRHHGDVLLSSSVFSLLKKRIPTAEIDAYLYDETYPMLEGHPAISNFILYDKKWKKLFLYNRLVKELRLLKKIRKQKYDLVINLTEGDRGAIAGWAAKSPYAVGFDPEGQGMWRKSRLYTHIVKHSPYPRHTVEKQLDALRVLGIFPTPEERELTFHIPIHVKNEMHAFLERERVPIDRYVLLHPVSRWSFKSPPASLFVELIRHFNKRHYKVVVTGSSDKKEQRFIDEILKGVTDISVCNLAGKISLKGLGSLIEMSHLLITIDSVPLHIASALKKPVVTIFGPTSEENWGPWQNPKSRVIFQKISCRPCYRAGCADSWWSDCLMNLSSQKIIQAIEELL